MTTAAISQDPLYQLLRNDDVAGFNQAIQQGQVCHLAGLDLRGLDLRGLLVSGMDLTDAYFRGTDLRGIDFRDCCLDGVSLVNSRVSGCYFPPAISAEELRLSLEFGTRLRHVHTPAENK
ncbi:pentapeptide repeat-containing protein [Oceanobacter antarcticus]|mgnify:FL=1|jgi:uncharacterized protein YjbI with pentapeptide repeats|uniref:Pentapeptide repeat-containing protein n=1 Tax=Oceanobacter antarcticus TaxID=3133425 RepID=A0ABW8NF38_9GAMM